MSFKDKKIIALIPARLDSTRLFAKSLLSIDDLPLIVHTYRRAKLSKYIDDIFICTDSQKIGKVAKKYKCKVIYTGKNPTGTDRISEAAQKIKLKYEIYIDIQGDEPLINPGHIDKVISWHIKNPKFDIVVPSLKFKYIDTPHIVKIVKSNNRILYFSRAKVPFPFRKDCKIYHKHLSIISFKPDSLFQFHKLKKSRLEEIEGVELMRALENNMLIGTFELKGGSFSVDTREDYKRAQAFMETDKLRKHY